MPNKALNSDCLSRCAPSANQGGYQGHPPGRDTHLKRPVWVAMVCGRKSPSDGEMPVCLLDANQVAEIIDFSSSQQSLTVRKPSGKRKLRVFKDRQERFLVAQSRLDNWDVPGA